MKLREFGGLVKDTVSDWLEDNAPRLGAALAYYTIFSLAPLLLLVISVAGLIFGHQAAEDQVVSQIKDLVGEDGGKAIRAMVENGTRPGVSVWGTVLGVGILLFSTTGLLLELQDDLNTIWGVKPKSGRGVWGFIKDRFLSFAMVLAIAFLLLVSLIVSATLAAIVDWAGLWRIALVGYAINEILSLTVVALLFALLFRYLPDVKIGLRDVWLGAIVTAVLFDVGKFLIGFYLGRSDVASAYGAAGSLAVLLAWLYYSGQIFLFGAELTKVYANKYGSHIIPADNAVPVTAEARAEQGIPRNKDLAAAQQERSSAGS